MAEEIKGETTIEDEVIGAIAGVAAREIEGVASLGKSSIRRTIAERVAGSPEQARGVDVEAGKKEAILDIDVNIIYGFSIPKIVGEVRRKVADRLEELAGLVAKEINITVVGIEFEEKPTRVE
ncbi:MAG: Asp23/Gls24 family envelope stress response protein [Dehalococcoidia bacterium]|nr:MAG: Asp23/Gls24 family envelope stress response protein [Dehalococcoidia bacterium]